MFTHDTQAGVIHEGPVRYLMMRPDVLMGIARELPAEHVGTFFTAFEKSAFRHSRRSFELYQAAGRFGTDDFLARTAEVAATLGWGSWSVTNLGGGAREIRVDGSPFAAGFGSASHPVCAAISGVLRAIALTGYGADAEVKEVACAAHVGGRECRFLLMPRTASESVRAAWSEEE
ncbi:MAG TPA: V4R domain-containing protein [Steroidobacteraceae bacterium]|nr:V4R domain-containing protein [Steroidobacteraceae bacterium]